MVNLMENKELLKNFDLRSDITGTFLVAQW